MGPELISPRFQVSAAREEPLTLAFRAAPPSSCHLPFLPTLGPPRSVTHTHTWLETMCRFLTHRKSYCRWPSPGPRKLTSTCQPHPNPCPGSACVLS